MKKTFFLVEDHSLMRQGISNYLCTEGDYGCAGCTDNAQEALAMLEQLAAQGEAPAVLITDLNLGTDTEDGIRLLRICRERYPDIKVIVYSMYASAGVVNLSLEAGASAYVSKADDERELVKAMGKVLAGESYLARSVVPKLLTYQNIVEGFSRREKEILTLVLQGLPNKQIAERLGIHKRAVENYISRIYDKTGFSTRAELVDQLSLEEL